MAGVVHVSLNRDNDFYCDEIVNTPAILRIEQVAPYTTTCLWCVVHYFKAIK